MTRRKMATEREEGILKAYANGVVISKIETDFNTSRASIYRILSRNNIKKERPNDGWTGKTHTEETKQKMSEARSNYWDTWSGEKGFTAEIENEIIKMYQGGIVISDIETKFKISKNRIYNLLKEKNINIDRIK